MKNIHLSTRVVAGITIAVLLLGLTACQSKAAKTKTALADKPPIVVYMGGGYWPGFFPIVLAHEKGFFAEEGASIEPYYPGEPSDRFNDFENGTYAGAAFPFADLMEMKTRIPDIRLVLVTDQSTTADAIVALPEIKTITDLKGKRVMAVPGAYGEVFILAMLEKANLTKTDITWIQLNQANEALDALKNGEIDALYIWEPYVSQAVANGGHVIFTAQDVPGLVIDGIVFHAAALAERPEEIQGFLRAWFRAVDYWQANPQEATALISSALKIDPAIVSLQGFRLMSLADNLKAFAPGETYDSLFYLGKGYNALFIQNAFITKPVDLDEFLDESFLNALK